MDDFVQLSGDVRRELLDIYQALDLGHSGWLPPPLQQRADAIAQAVWLKHGFAYAFGPDAGLYFTSAIGPCTVGDRVLVAANPFEKMVWAIHGDGCWN